MSFFAGVLIAGLLLLLTFGVIVINDLQTEINKLQSDLDSHLEADKLKDQLIADQNAEIERLQANQADPAVIDAMTDQVKAMDAKLTA